MAASTASGQPRPDDAPLVALAGWRSEWRDPRRAFLLAWVLFGLVFFSAAANKLPGYVLPLLPAAAVTTVNRLGARLKTLE